MKLLPKTLDPWKAVLADFPEDFQLVLGPWLKKIAHQLGPLKADIRSEDGDPEGVSGLARKGNYDRLLTSEWLLAEEYPDEFLRRAAMQEHLFFKINQQGPMGSQRCVVLLDGGPSQLGTPRLAHLALLLVMNERARHAQASFHWGNLHDRGRYMQSDIAPNALQHTWKASGSSVFAGQPSHLDSCVEELGTPLSADEWWLIGCSDEVKKHTQLPFSWVDVKESMVPGLRELVIEIKRFQHKRVELCLPLPSNASLVRMFRHTFESPAPPVPVPVRVPKPAKDFQPDLHSDLVFSRDNRRLIMRTEQGGLAAILVPNSPYAFQGNTIQFSPLHEDEVLLATSASGRNLFALTERKGMLFYYSIGKRGGLSGKPHTFRLSPESPTSEVVEKNHHKLSSIHKVTNANHTTNYLFRDPFGRLGRLIWETAEYEWLPWDIFAFGERHGVSVACACNFVANNPYEVITFKNFSQVFPTSSLAVTDLEQAFFGGPSELGGNGGYGMLAIELDERRWRIYYAHQLPKEVTNVEVVIDAGEEVVGTIAQPFKNDQPSIPALLVIDRDRTCLLSVSEERRVELMRSVAPLLRATASPTTGLVGYTCENGEVGVYSVAYHEKLAKAQHSGMVG
jgi:hypothetical protein